MGNADAAIFYYYIEERGGHGQGAKATHDSHRHTLNQNK
jgi:hypothetical protein